MTRDYGTLSDRELLETTGQLASQERRATADLIAALSEVDARRLYLPEGFSSLFTFCTGSLHLSEHAAYGRIEAARLVRRFPRALELLRDGSVNLTTLGLIAPYLTEQNSADVFAAIDHKSKREVEQIVATFAPKPAAATVIRRATAPRPSTARNDSTDAPMLVAEPETATSTASVMTDTANALKAVAPQRAVLASLSPERYKLQVTLSKAGYEALRGLQQLLRHSAPNGDPARIVERAFVELLERVRRNRLGESARPRTVVGSSPAGSRYIPAAVRRSVWTRDEGRCAFIGTAGRCSERSFLEFHHVVPFADGGAATVDNIQLRCRARNAFEAEEWDRCAPLLRSAIRSSAAAADRSRPPGAPERTSR